jgi:hypothetical protein
LWFNSFHCREKQTTGLFEFELGVCKLESMAGVGKKMEENPLEVERGGNGNVWSAKSTMLQTKSNKIN